VFRTPFGCSAKGEEENSNYRQLEVIKCYLSIEYVICYAGYTNAIASSCPCHAGACCSIVVLFAGPLPPPLPLLAPAPHPVLSRLGPYCTSVTLLREQLRSIPRRPDAASRCACIPRGDALAQHGPGSTCRLPIAPHLLHTSTPDAGIAFLYKAHVWSPRR
jgi:hypothetical protein